MATYSKSYQMPKLSLPLLFIPIIFVEWMTPICSASLSFSSASLSERIGPICEASSKWSNVYDDLISTLCPLISYLLLYIQQDHHQSSSITIIVIRNLFGFRITTVPTSSSKSQMKGFGCHRDRNTSPRHPRWWISSRSSLIDWQRLKLYALLIKEDLIANLMKGLTSLIYW